MGYYDSVYLNRVNRFGENLQQRVLNKKEYDFSNFIKKSPHKVTIVTTNGTFEGVLQTKEYDEIETIDYFLTYKSIPLTTGMIIKVLDIKNPLNKWSHWIITAKDNFVSAGYNRFTVVKMDREIRWVTEEGYLFKALTHISGGGANARDKRITSKFKINEDAIVFLPNQNLTLTMSDHEEIKRGVRININNQIWKISGKDNFTTAGVAYVTLEQDYTSQEDNDLELTREKAPISADEEKEAIPNVRNLERWEFNTNFREQNELVVRHSDQAYRKATKEDLEDETILKENLKIIELKEKTDYPITLSIKYFAKDCAPEVVYETEYKNKVEFINSEVDKKGVEHINFIRVGEFFKDEEGRELGVKLTVRLKDNPDIFQEYVIFPKNNESSQFSVEGPTRIKLRKPEIIESIYEFTPGKFDEQIMEITKLSERVENEKTYYRYQIVGLQIINSFPVTFYVGENDEYTVNFKIESPWIGGIM